MAVLITFRNAGNQVPVVIVTARDQFDDRTSATLSVSDTGPGIAPADHLRVVEPFYRGLDNRCRFRAGLADRAGDSDPLQHDSFALLRPATTAVRSARHYGAAAGTLF